MRLIDADSLVKNMTNFCNRSQFGRSTAKFCIKQEPTVDAKPVVHSKWNKAPHLNVYTCDYCGRLFRDYAIYYSYCPYCGALMDMEDSNES